MDKKIKPYRHLPSKTPHPKFQCWKKLYLTASVFRVWFFLPTGAKRSPKTTLKFAGAGVDNNTARVWFHRPSTVVQYWYTEYTEYTGLVSPNIFQLTCKLDHLLETVRAFSLSLSLSVSLSLSPQIESVTKSFNELPIACLVCFTFSFCFCISQHFSLPVKFFCWSKTTRLVLWRLAVWKSQWSEIWLVCALKACQLSICFIHFHTKN